MLASEAYGVGSCMADRSRFVGANMGLVPLGKKWARAVNATRVGYQDARGMIQSLIWEPYPESIDAPLASNDLIGKAVAATPFKPPLPLKQVGVVILANKSYPLSAGVAAGYKIVGSIVRAER
ncbi:serine hydrolase [Burkholderia thailandensis]|uniref:serine hydrolase n=1 Tax=Burkholderia thailandensis TaxID=57975 RepID=UPI0004F60D64|nr:serine hydrolase [Burkholderia thailandensis]AIP27739.1 putative beta-lactamase [Burkholderia thailandensis E264]MCS6478049.1 serine hydrolase [Burkholderia thailandensis]MCS6506987.1 serine hydrolase [Burkholderia thailandensis]WRS69441.1 serine hydrolase [Burkholderia thailandensis]